MQGTRLNGRCFALKALYPGNIMPEPIQTLYDNVLYPSAPYPQTHPDRLATMATLFGMQPSPCGGVAACSS